MLLKNMLKVILLFSFSIVLVNSLYSQDELDNSLDGQYELLMKKSTTYQDYKVIKVVGINQLWENINDSIASINTNYYAAQAKIANLNNELSAVKDSLDLTSKALEESGGGFASLGNGATEGAKNFGCAIFVLFMILQEKRSFSIVGA